MEPSKMLEQKKLDDEKELLEELRAKETMKIEERLSSLSDVIHLDVRGTVFMTKKHHLMMHEGSYFHAMLSSGRFEPDHHGSYYIDRDPTLFKVILDFVESADGVLDTKLLSKAQLAELDKQIDYFQLSYIKWKWNEADFCTVSNGGLTVCSNCDFAECIAFGSQTVLRFTVKVDEYDEEGYGSLDIGFTNESYDRWTIGCRDGVLSGTSSATPWEEADSAPQHIEDYPCGPIHAGDVLTVVKQGNSISFEKNGISYGPAPFAYVPEEDLFPTFYCCDSYSTVTILN